MRIQVIHGQTIPRLPDGEYTVHKKQRTDRENRAYWGIIVQTLSDEIGYSPEEMHDALKRLFLTEIKEVRGRDGKRVEIAYTRSTASLETFQFEDYCSKIRTWASCELGVYLPLPNEEIA